MDKYLEADAAWTMGVRAGVRWSSVGGSGSGDDEQPAEIDSHRFREPRGNVRRRDVTQDKALGG